MRYEIDQKVPFLHVKFENPNGSSNADGLSFFRYLPWENKLLGIDIRMLTCVERSIVPAKDDEREQHIFVFHDENGQRWINEGGYPEYAARDIGSEAELNAEMAKGVNLFEMKALNRYLADVSRGVFDISEEIAKGEINVEKYQGHADMLQAHYDEVVSLFEQQTGLRVVRTERKFGSGVFRGFYNVAFEAKIAA